MAAERLVLRCAACPAYGCGQIAAYCSEDPGIALRQRLVNALVPGWGTPNVEISDEDIERILRCEKYLNVRVMPGCNCWYELHRAQCPVHWVEIDRESLARWQRAREAAKIPCPECGADGVTGCSDAPHRFGRRGALGTPPGSIGPPGVPGPAGGL